MLDGSRIRLDTIGTGHLPYLLDLVGRQELRARWLSPNVTRAPAQLEAALRSCLAVFVVTDKLTSEAAGLVGCYEADLADGHAKIGMLSDVDPVSSELVVHGAILLVEYVFAVWHLRKVYFEFAEGTSRLPPEVSLRVARLEGRLRDHLFHQGAYRDLLVLAIDRHTWETTATPVLDMVQDLGD